MKSREIAETGIFCALTIVVLFLASIIPINKLFLSAISAFLLELFRKRNGLKLTLTVYMVSALLAFLIIPQKSLALLYLTVFGGYVVMRNILSFRSVVLKKGFLLLFMDAMIAGLYFLANQLFEGTFDIVLNRPSWQIFILFFVLQLAIFLYDYALTLAIDVLEKYLKKMGI